MSSLRRLALVSLTALLVAVAPPAPGSHRALAAGTWTWPVEGPVLRAFDPPDSPYGAGHRGIDIAAPVGSVVVAPAAGVVSFAGPVGGRLFLTIDHGAGLESTSSFLSGLLVRRGDRVEQEQPVATSGAGHTGDEIANLHFGVRLDDVYVDPLAYLTAVDVRSLIRLVPVEPPSPLTVAFTMSRPWTPSHPARAGPDTVRPSAPPASAAGSCSCSSP